MFERVMPSGSVCGRGHHEPSGDRGARVLRRALPGWIVASWVLAACAQAPAESRSTANVLTIDFIDPAIIISTRKAANAIVGAPIADDKSNLSGAASALLATDNGRTLLSFIVSCALPEDAVLVATLDGTELDFFGELGVAPQWQSAPLDLAGQRWVTACLLARVNVNDVALPLSARGPNLALTADDVEREIAPLEEGAFYGNIFLAPDEPIQWFACEGRDQAAGETGGLLDRDCAEPDPAKPGLTKCGFIYAGNCNSVAGPRACESFSVQGTYYQRCHTSAGPPGHWPGLVFEEVITTFAFE